jgi:hypothetical protein
MLFTYRNDNGKLVASGVKEALWLDLCKPEPEELAQVAGMVPEVPTLADLEEIEIWCPACRARMASPRSPVRSPSSLAAAG